MQLHAEAPDQRANDLLISIVNTSLLGHRDSKTLSRYQASLLTVASEFKQSMNYREPSLQNASGGTP